MAFIGESNLSIHKKLQKGTYNDMDEHSHSVFSVFFEDGSYGQIWYRSSLSFADHETGIWTESSPNYLKHINQVFKENHLMNMRRQQRALLHSYWPQIQSWKDQVGWSRAGLSKTTRTSGSPETMCTVASTWVCKCWDWAVDGIDLGPLFLQLQV